MNLNYDTWAAGKRGFSSERLLKVSLWGMFWGKLTSSQVWPIAGCLGDLRQFSRIAGVNPTQAETPPALQF